MKIDCIKTALADDIGIASTEFGCTKFYSLANGIALASIAFGCTHRKHTCQGAPPKTPEKNKSRKDGINSWRRKQKELSFG